MRVNTILAIIEKRGGIEKLKADGAWKIKTDSKSIMPLNIDYIGKGPNGHDAIAVAHNYLQNGDVMADPDMQMEIADFLRGPELYPYTFQQDPGIYQEIYTLDETGKVKGVRVKLQKELRSFVRTWGANLRKQGFLKAA